MEKSIDEIIGVDIKPIIKEFELNSENETIGAMAYKIGALRKEVVKLKKDNEYLKCLQELVEHRDKRIDAYQKLIGTLDDKKLIDEVGLEVFYKI